MIWKPKFKQGDVVLLHADPADFPPEQYPPDEVGAVEGAEAEYPQMYIVRVKHPPDDADGLREVSEDQMSYYRPTGHRRS